MNFIEYETNKCMHSQIKHTNLINTVSQILIKQNFIINLINTVIGAYIVFVNFVASAVSPT